jgi:aerobic carbon-monoxide dehydrogenase large subunit
MGGFLPTLTSLATYVEITAGDGQAGETARLAVHDDGTVTFYTGS